MTEKIKSLFETRQEHPLFYVESGSRLWGIASPDSDFDVRGFHLQPKEQYFDFKRHRDLIEIEKIKMAKDSLEKKKRKAEQYDVEADKKPSLLEKIKVYTRKLSEIEPERTNDPKKLAGILRKYIFDLKNEYYQ